MRLKIQLFSIFTMVVFYTGCQLGPAYHPPTIPIPTKWKHVHNKESDASPVCYWWEVFNDPVLNELEEQAIENNNDLYAALERVREARALAGISEADLYPQINLDFVYSNQIRLERLFNNPTPIVGQPQPPSIIRVHELLYSLPLKLSYELDLWGRLQSLYQSAFFTYQEQVQALQSTFLILTTDLANSYFQLRALDAQKDLLISTIATREKALEINRSRYEGRIINFSDVSRASTELTNTQADFYDILRQRDIQENRIATLIGVASSDFSLEHLPLSSEPPSIPAGLPSDILIQRPDIAQAERAMAAENALVKAAYASFFPTIELTAALGFSSPTLKDFLKWRSRFWSIGSAIDQTVFDGWRKSSTYDLTIARFEEASYSYQQLVLTAFEEVEDALSSIEFFQKEFESIENSVRSTKITHQISLDRYLDGIDFYLSVVDSERDELNAQRNLISLLGFRYSATLQLIKALGGVWHSSDEILNGR